MKDHTLTRTLYTGLHVRILCSHKHNNLAGTSPPIENERMGQIRSQFKLERQVLYGLSCDNRGSALLATNRLFGRQTLGQLLRVQEV